MPNLSESLTVMKDYWQMSPDEQVEHDIAETVCAWKSGVGGEALWDCEECDQKIPEGETVHFISDGGYDGREGTYVGPCCVRKFFDRTLYTRPSLPKTSD